MLNAKENIFARKYKSQLVISHGLIRVGSQEWEQNGSRNRFDEFKKKPILGSLDDGNSLSGGDETVFVI